MSSLRDDDFETAPLSGSDGKHGAADGMLGRVQQKFPWLTVANTAIAVLLTLCIGLSVALFRCGGGAEATISSMEGVISGHHDDADVLATFLVVGDWGRRGEFNQTNVAAAMGEKANTLHPQFVISTGDNFYPHGLNSTYDKEFEFSFRDVYDATGLQVPWYAVLGNHDYGDGSYDAEDCLALGAEACGRGPLSELDMELVRRDERWHCSRLYSLSLADGKADLFFMDSSPLIQQYHTTPWASFKEGILSQSWESQVRELESMLARSTAQWKVLIAHHPVRSNGEHGDNAEMLEHVQPMLEKYNVRVAFHGHDHDLEHIHVGGQKVHYVISGAGSETREMSGDKDALFQWPASGFTAVTLRRDVMTIEFLGMQGDRPLYSTTIPRLMNATGW